MKIVSLLRIPVLTLLAFAPTLGFSAQPNRIFQAITSSKVVPLPGSSHPLAQPQFDQGRIDGSTRMQGLSIQFQPSEAQQADLNQLLTDQQNPSSPLYHQWLTPAQFGSRFGLSDADLEKVQSWLQSEGFVIESISNARNRISFSGTVSQVEAAFRTELHNYKIGDEIHMANASEISIPASLSGVVLGVQHLSNFRPKPHYHRPAAQFTSWVSGTNFVSPGDITTIYDLGPLYTANFDGTGAKIAIVGQSAINNSDIEHFQAAAGLTKKDPTMLLVPNTGTSTHSTGDETESDLDVEWSGAIAKGATIVFVYTGCTGGNCSTTQFGAFDALVYAIDTKTAPIISSSYGTCEPNLTLSSIATFNAVFQQANAQGQTIISASGDSGAADCDNSASTPLAAATHGLAVDFPAVTPFVTGIGGTEFNEGSGSYWTSVASGSKTDLVSSAKSYIPETVWDVPPTISGGVVTNGFSGAGGGKSIYFAKPSWQTGNGVPADGARDVPDISLDASNAHDTYLFCSIDADPLSCSLGFRDGPTCSSSTDTGCNLTTAGGTSFGAPIFAGMLAVMSQKLSATSGLGNINPAFYSLFSSTPSAFHDVTTGSNDVPCTVGSTVDCPTTGSFGYSATTGYDLATGIGTIDANVLASGLAALGVGALARGTTTTLTPSVTTPGVNAAVTFNVIVSANDASGAPTGTVQFAVDGTNSGSPVSLSSKTITETTPNGSVNYTEQQATLSLSAGFATTGAHTVTATYSGDSNFSGSSATLGVTVASGGAFTMKATNVTVSQGSSGTSTVTVTPTGGYKGTIAYVLNAPSTLTSSCYSISNSSVTAATAVTATLTIFTSSTDCVGAANRHPLGSATPNTGSRPVKTSRTGNYLGMAGTALASVLLLGFPGFRRRRGSAFFALIALAVLSFAVGCGGGGGGGGSSATLSAKGTYNLTLTGTDSANNVTSSATLTLTVQ